MPVSMWRGTELWKPLIAAINGTAAGAGLELALACDLRIAVETAKFSFPEVMLGDFPGWGGAQRLARFVSQCKAAEMLMLGLPMDAQEAYRIGLVDEVYPPEQLMDKAMEMAKLICSKGPVAVALAKESINRELDVSLPIGCDFEKGNFAQVCGTDDKTEGCKAFLEKRPAKFTGK